MADLDHYFAIRVKAKDLTVVLDSINSCGPWRWCKNEVDNIHYLEDEAILTIRTNYATPGTYSRNNIENYNLDKERHYLLERN